MERDIFIALGSNVGDRELNLLRAVADLALLPDSRVTALSPFYDTEPVGISGADNFLNAVLRLESRLGPEELLDRFMSIETETFQRQRSGRVDSRSMDLDILFYGDRIVTAAPALIIPHPRLHQRRFVLEPLAAIAPEFMHPLLQKTVSELLAELDDNSRVIRT